ncbi:RHS repeat-associated core domain-containing protein [Streptomyces sp. NPDC008343]|uniref:RHS repeat-associated core domain-containing protein n=1 Tax=Streptomyces sp. NPDC008343 TaxID=3364828 RepID=UPI0036ECF795
MEVDLDPGRDGRNYTGCPTFCASADADKLVSSPGAIDYTYQVAFTGSDRTRLVRSYNRLHLLKKEEVFDSSKALASRTELAYPGEKDGKPPVIGQAPATYQLPGATTVSAFDTADGRRAPHRVEAKASFDSAGRQVSQEAGGVSSTIRYGANGLPVHSESVDPKTGQKQVTDNTLTEDQKNIRTSVTKAVTVEDGKEHTETVSRSEYTYYTDTERAGEVKSVSTTGNPDAKGADPGAAVTRTDVSVDKAKGTRTDTVTDPAGVSTTQVSDLVTGLVLSTKTAGQEPTTHHYDAAGQETKTAAPGGQVTEHEYHTGPNPGDNKIVTRRTSDGYTSIESFDALGRTVTVQDNYRPDTGKLTNSDSDGDGLRTLSAQHYNQAGQVDTTTDTAGRETHLAYDTLGQLKSTTTPDGITTTYTTDPVQATTTTSVFAKGAGRPAVTSVSTADDEGRVTETRSTYGDGKTPPGFTNTDYNAFGQPLSTSGSASSTLEHHYDASGLMHEEVMKPTAGADGAEVTASYGHDAFGRPTGKTLREGSQQTSSPVTSYDAAGRAEVVTDQAGERTVNRYDKDGRLETVSRPDGHVLHRAYDHLDRVTDTWVTTPDKPSEKAQHVHTDFDPVTGQPAAVFDAADEDGTKVTYAYNPDGSTEFLKYADGATLSYTYNKDGSPATFTDSAKTTTRYAYNDDGSLHEARATDRDGAERARATYGYDALGQLRTLTRGNGMVSTYERNDASEITEETHKTKDGTTVERHQYVYYDTGKLKSDTAEINGDHTATLYTYDSAGRLTGATTTSGDKPGEGSKEHDVAYAPDLASNVTKETTRSKDGDTTTEYRFDDRNRTSEVVTDGSSVKQKYDAAGHVVQDVTGTGYTYNPAGELVAVRKGGQESKYTYWPTGKRKSKTLPDGTTITYHYGTDGELAEEVDDHGAHAGYLLGATREARLLTGTKAQSVAYYTKNRRGDVTSTSDAGARETQRYSYGPYGELLTPDTEGDSITANPFGYANAYTDRSQGLLHLGARYYSPVGHAFLTADPAGMLNLYTYAGADPVNNVDPTGLFPQLPGWLDSALNWSGLPYLDMGLGALGLGMAVASGAGLGPLALAGLGAAGSMLAAADQIAIHTRGSGFLPQWAYWGITAAGVLDVAAAIPSVVDAVQTIRRYPAALQRLGGTATNPGIYGGLLDVTDGTLWSKRTVVALGDLPDNFHREVAAWMRNGQGTGKATQPGIYVGGWHHGTTISTAKIANKPMADAAAFADPTRHQLVYGSSAVQHMMWGTEAPARVAVHEFGHALDYARGNISRRADFAAPADAIKFCMEQHPLHWFRGTFDYITSPAELWAEAASRHLRKDSGKFLHPTFGSRDAAIAAEAAMNFFLGPMP